MHHLAGARRAAQLGALLLVTAAGPAWAARPGEWVLGLGPSYAYIKAGPNSFLGPKAEPKGGGITAHLHYSLTSAIALRVVGGWTGHAIDAVEKDPGGTYHVISAAAGARYAFDLLALNPALEVGVGVLHHRYQDKSKTSPALQVGIACDYWILPWLSVGLGFHYHAYLSSPNEYPVYFDAGPRFGLRLP